ncbi:hypothetical protein MUK42_34827 [Musa troglodytarum]|uniref:Uncharacterized protein n=1 Tax=Musa troglodytarum TaxID=320322 RepID=A0A9E7JVC9_9LILI|nr:hypothetical protein MUK42_34827 [Musa troglodytarum]
MQTKGSWYSEDVMSFHQTSKTRTRTGCDGQEGTTMAMAIPGGSSVGKGRGESQLGKKKRASVRTPRVVVCLCCDKKAKQTERWANPRSPPFPPTMCACLDLSLPFPHASSLPFSLLCSFL